MPPIITTDRLGQNHLRSRKYSFCTIICNCLLLNTFNYVDFLYVTQTTLTATARYTYYQGWAKNKMLGSLPALKSSAAHLNLIWTIKSFDSAEACVWGRGGNLWWKGAWGWSAGFCWKLCKNEFPRERSGTSWFWLGQKYHKVFLETSKIFGRPSSKQFATSACLGFGQTWRQKYVQGETV